MRATNWEFKNRALVFGLIFTLAFVSYRLDHRNATAVLANWLGAALRIDANLIARLLFIFATLLLVVAAFSRTWGSAYLHANVVYATDVRTESLVADGPYRYVRNPLYFGNLPMAIGIGALMSQTGFFIAVVAIPVFCCRLILREESEFQANKDERYERYRKAVPRLWPSLRPRIASSGSRANWAEGFKAEFWCWGCAVAVAVFAITLNITAFLALWGISLVALWFSSTVLQKKMRSARPTNPQR